MAYTPPNSNGQATSANSAPVVIASDQTTIKTKLANDIASTTGTITTATSTVVATNLTGVGSINVTIYGTYSNVTIVFDAFDGTNWLTIPFAQTNTIGITPVISSGSLSGLTLGFVATPVLGFSQFRVRATTWTSGTANIIINPSAQFVSMQSYSSGIVTVSQPTAAQLNATVVQSGTWTVQPGNTQNTTPWLVREGPANTGTITQVTPAVTSTTLKAANTARKAVILYNAGTSDCYVAYGATAATTAFTFILPSLGTTTIRGEEYAGLITGIWLATGGNSMQVTEIV